MSGGRSLTSAYKLLGRPTLVPQPHSRYNLGSSRYAAHTEEAGLGDGKCQCPMALRSKAEC